MLRRLFWPALTTGLMLALTVGLGVWQVQRLTWKRALLAEIDRGEAAPPVPLPSVPQTFQKVVARGRFLPQVARYGAEVRSVPAGPVMGAHVLSPLQVAAGEPVMVDRGWAPLEFDATPPAGPVTVEGYIRPPDHATWLTIGDDVPARRFYTLDPVAIGSALGLAHVAPFTLVALGPAGGVPEPASALPRPPNDHLAYAITWFGLALALLAVFGVYVRQSMAAGSALR